MSNDVVTILRNLLRVSAAFALTYYGISALTPSSANNLPDIDSPFPWLAPGVVLHVNGVNFATAPASLILVTSPFCAYCQANKSVHQRLARNVVTMGVKVYVALPNGVNSSFLDLPPGRIEIPFKDVKARLRGTPTIILVDGRGEVLNIWAGSITNTTADQIADLAKTLTVARQSGD